MSKSQIIWISLAVVVIIIIAIFLIQSCQAAIKEEEKTKQLQALLQSNQNLQISAQNSGFFGTLGSFFGQVVGSAGTAVGGLNPGSLGALIGLF